MTGRDVKRGVFAFRDGLVAVPEEGRFEPDRIVGVDREKVFLPRRTTYCM